MLKRTYLLTAFCLLSLVSSAQIEVILPYFTGFDNTEQKAGWTEFKTAATTFSHWNFSDSDAFSETTCIHHDYSPSTGITLTDNWFVSPQFSLATGGTLDSLRYRFTGFSVPGDNDTIAVYLLIGSQDPELASSVILLHDFRGADYITDGTYRNLMDINLIPTLEASFIAIRYRNSDCSSNWLTVDFDNVAINGGASAGIDNQQKLNAQISLYPNPSNGVFYLTADEEIITLEVMDILGNQISVNQYSKTNKSIEIELGNVPTGIYFIRVKLDSGIYTKKLTIN